MTRFDLLDLNPGVIYGFLERVMKMPHDRLTTDAALRARNLFVMQGVGPHFRCAVLGMRKFLEEGDVCEKGFMSEPRRVVVCHSMKKQECVHCEPYPRTLTSSPQEEPLSTGGWSNSSSRA